MITPIRTADDEMVKALTMLTTNSFIVSKLPAPIEPLQSNTKYMSAFGILQTAKEMKYTCSGRVFSIFFELTKNHAWLFFMLKLAMEMKSTCTGRVSSKFFELTKKSCLAFFLIFMLKLFMNLLSSV